YVGLRDRGNAMEGFRKLGLPGLGVAISFALSMGTFILALEKTAVANVLIFQAAAPFVAAVLGWIWLRERVSPGGAESGAPGGSAGRGRGDPLRRWWHRRHGLRFARSGAALRRPALGGDG